MTATADQFDRRQHTRWRIVGWGLAGCLLLVPLVAMQFDSGVYWTAADFLLFGAMLALAGGALELAARLSADLPFRLGFGIAVAAGFLLVWVNLAVGMLGEEGDRANLLFAGVLAVAMLGSIVVRFRPAGMARAMWITAAAQGLVGLFALAARLGSVYEAVLGTGLFGALWLIAGWQFRRAANRADIVPA